MLWRTDCEARLRRGARARLVAPDGAELISESERPPPLSLHPAMSTVVDSSNQDELENFRREWLLEAKANASKPKPKPAAASTSDPPPAPSSSTARAGPASPTSQRRQLPSTASRVDGLGDELSSLALAELGEEPRMRAFSPKTALDLYWHAVQSEKEGRLNDGKHTKRGSLCRRYGAEC